MSFFGFEQNDLEKEKRKFLEGGRHDEDLAVYTWGEDSYDGLGDALHERGDELNDETFGGSGPIGKDFDFGHPAPNTEWQQSNHAARERDRSPEQLHHARPLSPQQTQPSTARTAHSLESIWDDKSPFSVLPRSATNGTGRSLGAQHARQASATGLTGQQAKYSPLAGAALPARYSPAQSLVSDHSSLSRGTSQAGVRTLEEIEAEMRVAAQQSREAAQRAQLAQPQQYPVQQHTPPPRMHPHAQSPRFHQLQQQILIQQQQHHQQQQLQLQGLQEQLRMEEIERHLRAQQLHDSPHQVLHQRRQSPSLLSVADLHQLAQLQQEQRRRQVSPLGVDSRYHMPQPLEEGMQFLPSNIQMQQRLLAELAQEEFIREYGHTQQHVSPEEQELLRTEAMRKIMEAERMEEKRRRKAAKINHMSRYNDLMTQSDKDFITRIQVSQLVTQDPYAEDFYAQVYGALMRSRLGLQSGDERVLKFGSGVGVGLGLPGQRPSGRKQSAVQRMEAQVERIVMNARQREREKGLHSLNSLQGALGKTAGRSYKAAPRQLLQVDTPKATHVGLHDEYDAHTIGEHAAKEAAKLGREALGEAAGASELVHRDPLSRFESLAILEELYDTVLDVEQLRREQPPTDDEDSYQFWNASYADRVGQLWDGLKVMVPLETSNPHPFVSLLTPIKGKKVLPRIARHLSGQQMLTVLTLLVACFSQLDVVVDAPLLDSLQETEERKEVERQTQAFLGSVLQSILPVIAKASLRLVSGLLGLLLDRSDIVVVSRTRPGLALLTLFLSRVEVIKQNMVTSTDSDEDPTPEEEEQWQLMFDHLFQLIAPHLLSLFPSVRIARSISSADASLTTDHTDQPVWQFLAALGLHAVLEQQQLLVTSLREKVLDIVLSVNKGWVADEEERRAKLGNVNIFLHALGIDSSQIVL
ncbi:hypothetical protein JAAARDRAFT_31002 [Jaapia argillacea MUCL 33604]|uniref:mRNA decay factor PAT1 domain-containing protein n=1 Tax=Jaapia argillacea MUCL 33604 TaxID=933084 RepID=A0A067Q3A7_9AGAM|nr:hypothetical protein JAAARDRAFT_31002 [Jaapia argillacea MUCL 33604]